MPGNHIEGREIMFGSKKLTAKHLNCGIHWMGYILKPGYGWKKIPRSRQTIRIYRNIIIFLNCPLINLAFNAI